MFRPQRDEKRCGGPKPRANQTLLNRTLRGRSARKSPRNAPAFQPASGAMPAPDWETRQPKLRQTQARRCIVTRCVRRKRQTVCVMKSIWRTQGTPVSRPRTTLVNGPQPKAPSPHREGNQPPPSKAGPRSLRLSKVRSVPLQGQTVGPSIPCSQPIGAGDERVGRVSLLSLDCAGAD